MATDIIRVTIKGTLAGGEVWSINPCFGFGDFGTITPTVSEMNAAATAVNAVNPGAMMLQLLSSAGAVTGCRIEARTLAGGLELVSENNRGSVLQGTSTPVAPPQTAVALSLRTDRAGGRGRGRAYWPALGVSLSTSTLRWNTTQMPDFLSQSKTYLSGIITALNGAFGESNGQLNVWSRASASRQYVTSLQIGNVVDSQRRRRDGYPEAYSSVSFP